MKKIMSLVLLLAFITPIPSAQAAGCAQVKTMIKSLGNGINFSDTKGAKNMVDAFEIAFKNPKCLPKKDISEMRITARELIIECSKPDTVYKSLFTRPIFDAFCGGFKKLSKYTK